MMLTKSWIKAIAILVAAMAVGLEATATDEPVVINYDHSVTINYYAPHAEQVEVQGNFIRNESVNPLSRMIKENGKAKMKPMGNGMWSYTSEPLPSDLFWYNFKVDDGKECIDRDNSDVVRNVNTMYNYFIVGGGIGDDYMDNPQQRGELRYVWYPSNMNGMTQRRMTVYLPDAYFQDESRRFPVLYLLHGSGGDEKSWSECGRLAQIMDNLIAEGRCEPMIVVMPNGIVTEAAAPGDDPSKPNAKASGQNISSMFGKIEKAFVPEVVRFVDSNYRTLADSENRAIAGFSLGGLHTLFTSVNNPSTFGYIGLFSAQTTNALNNTGIDIVRGVRDGWNRLKNGLDALRGRAPSNSVDDRVDKDDLYIYEDFERKLDKLFANRPELFYIAVGTGDFTKKLNDSLRAELDRNNHPYVYNETEGGHTWTNWRRYLIDFLPRLFNNQKLQTI